MSLEVNGLDVQGGPSPPPARVIAQSGSVPGEWVLKFPTSVRKGVVFLGSAPAGGVRFEIVPLDRPVFSTRLSGGAAVVLQRITRNNEGEHVETLAEFADAGEAEAVLSDLIDVLRRSAVRSETPPASGFFNLNETVYRQRLAALLFGCILLAFAMSYFFLKDQRPSDLPSEGRVGTEPPSATVGGGEWNPRQVLPAPRSPSVQPEHALPSAWGRATPPTGTPSPTPAATLAVEETFAPRPAPPVADPNPGAVLSPEASSVIAALGPSSATVPAELQATVGQAGQVGSWAVEDRVPLPGHITAHAQAPGDVFIQSLTAPTIGYAELAKLAPAPAAGGLPASPVLGPASPIHAPAAASGADAFMDAVRQPGQQP